jgi:DNA-binding protein HU-beta
METYTRKDLIERTAKALGMSQPTVSSVMETLISEIRSVLKDGNCVVLRGFGSFKPHYRKERTLKIPRLNQDMVVPASTTVKFKPSKDIIQDGQ